MPISTQFSAARHRGSVLILVVVVVVLLALLGTALLSTSRGDRFTAVQHRYNTQIDILVQSVQSLARGAIDQGLSGTDPNATTTTTLRPPTETSATPLTTDYHNYDAVTLSTDVHNLGDSFLSPRAPMLSPSPFPAGAGSVFHGSWASIGTFLIGSGFESPLVFKESTGLIDLTVSSKFTQTINSAAVGDFFFEPTSVKVASDGKYYPAFRKTIGGIYYDFMAGDADGDGIADSGLFRLPVGQIDGVDYFAAVRIVDANSQVNLNTAWSRSGDHAPGVQATNANIVDATNAIALGNSAADNLGWFQSHVGLQEMLNRSDTFNATALATPYTYGGTGNWQGERNAATEMLALNRARFGFSSSQTAGLFVPAAIYQDANEYDATNTTTAWPTPGFYAGAAFITQGDSLEHQLAYRLRNPGLGQGAASNYGSFAISNAVSLAYHGGLMINPDISKSPIESVFFTARSLDPSIPAALPDSIYASASNFRDNNTPFANGKAGSAYGFNANEAWRWLLDYYNSDATATRSVFDPQMTVGSPGTPTNYPVTGSAFPEYACARPFLTTWSPTSNLVQRHLRPMLPTAPAGVANSTSMGIYHVNAGKTSVNTATFEDLWLAFWNVMADKQTGTAGGIDDSYSPFGATTYNNTDDIYNGMNFNVGGQPYSATVGQRHPQKMFRSSIREFHAVGAQPVYFPPTSEMALRSGLAALQTVQLRKEAIIANKGAQQPEYRTVALNAVDSAGAPIALTVRMFGVTPQPFFTEFYANTDAQFNTTGTDSNPVGYAAVELYNPFDVPINLGDGTYDLVAIGRTEANGGYPIAAYAGNAGQNSWNEPVPWTLPGVATIAPKSWMIIENFGAPANAAGHRPASSGLPINGPINGAANVVVIPADLSVAYNKELVLRRHVVATDATPIGFCAIDSIYLGGFNPLPAAAITTCHTYHYARPSGAAANNNWRCVYPGRYVGVSTATAVPSTQPANTSPLRQQGDDTSGGWTSSTTMDMDPWRTTGGSGLGTGNSPAQAITPKDVEPTNGSPTVPITLGAADAAPSWTNPGGALYSTFTIPLGGSGMASDTPGPNPRAGVAQFPFGAFAREGDMLQIPYIGAYTIQDAAGGFYEMNSISTDAAFAEDTDLEDDEHYTAAGTAYADATSNLPLVAESVGRFCPVSDVDSAVATATRDDLDPNDTYTGNWNYRWATRLFDYLTVESPSQDFLPNYDQSTNATLQPVDSDGDTIGNGSVVAGPPILNNEDIEPRQGLININTAPWQVLATLPIFKAGNNNTLNAATGVWNANGAPAPEPAAGDPIDDNAKLAKAIVRWRDGDPINGLAAKGPFHSIFDLYRVPAFAGASAVLMNNPLGNNGPDASQGDFSPNVAGAGADDFSRFDYKEQFLLLNKISNLITTRSDSFVVYIEVQGWRNLGTAKAELAVHRHVAFIQDRWHRTATVKQLESPVPVPND